MRVLLHSNVQRFRGGLVFKAHRLVYHSTLGLRVIKKKRRESEEEAARRSLLAPAAESTGGSVESQVRIPDLAFHFKSPFPLAFRGFFKKPFKIELRPRSVAEARISLGFRA